MTNDLLLTDGEGHFKLSGNRWENIGMIIQKWSKKYPIEAKRMKQDIVDARNDYKTVKYKERPMRKALLIDPRLMYAIQRFYPDFMETNQDLRTFADKFPTFVIDEGVMSVKE